MTRTKSARRFRYKLIGISLAAVIGGIALLKLSQVVYPSEKQKSTVAATAPDEQMPTKPREEDTAQNLSGLLLLFAAASFGLAVICIGWLVVDIRNARPAWKTQKKYPKKR